MVDVDEEMQKTYQQEGNRNFNTLSEQQLFNHVLSRFNDYEFEQHKSIDVADSPCSQLALYEIDYFKLKLNVLELFEEGEFILGNRIKFRRYYADCSTSPSPHMYAYVTEISDVTIEKKHASLAMVHGFAETQDVFFEASLQFALNGFYVHLVDLEGFGFSAGARVNNLSVEKFHHQVTTVLEQVRPDLPCFLFGHSMGGLTVNSYLGYNPNIAKRLAGVIYSAPFFGQIDGTIDFGKKIMVSILKNFLEEFVVVAPLQTHKICKKKVYIRQIIQQRKAHPFLSLGLVDSFIRNQDLLMTHAGKITYPYLLVLGEKDEIVNNRVTRVWHSKTQSKEMTIKLMAGAYHELTKEPNNHVLFEAMLKFMAGRLGSAKAFGEFKGKRDVKQIKQRPAWKSKWFWKRVILAYLLIGLLIAVVRRQKGLFLSWPSILVIAKRFK